ncbi:MAG TPA: acyl carrier protein [Terriglobales bacterium]|nr:acyl carrier protein [Terriglobales bacterium]
MQIEAATIEQEIRKFLTDEFLSGNGDILNEDVPLLGNVIDSQGVINLVAFVQERFNIEVSDDDVTTENLASVKTVVELIERKLREKQ